MGPRGWPVLVCVLVAPAPALAQGALPPDPVTDGRLHAGPVQLHPRLELGNIGVDSNIFNDPETPVEDFTLTFRPTLGAGLRVGRGRITSSGWLDFIYFKDYASERAVNRFGEVRGELRLERLIPNVRAAGLVAKDRPNSEIDLRARRTQQDFSGGLAVALFSRTAAFVAVQEQTLAYDAGQIYNLQDLAQQLNHTLRTVEGGLRLALTTLTTLSVTASREEQRFETSQERDSDSTKVTARFDFDPDAVIRGTAIVGYRRFEGVSEGLRDYSGMVAQVQVGWRYQDRTHVDVRFSRDLDYSVEDVQPYYVRSAAGLTVRQRIGGPVDVQASFGRDTLRYRTLDIAGLPEEGAVDTTDTIGAGLGYWFGETIRAGLNYEFASRSGRDRYAYDRRRVFGSLAYGF